MLLDRFKRSTEMISTRKTTFIWIEDRIRQPVISLVHSDSVDLSFRPGVLWCTYKSADYNTIFSCIQQWSQESVLAGEQLYFLDGELRLQSS